MVLGVGLSVIGLCGWWPKPFLRLSLVDVGDAAKVWHVVRSLAVALTVDLAAFGLLGGLVAATPAGSKRVHQFLAGLLCSVLALPAILIIRACGAFGWPEGVNLIVPVGGYAIGAWTVCVWRLGLWGRLSLVPQLAAALAAVAMLPSLCLEDKPLAFSTERITSAEKRRLVDVVRTNQVPERAAEYLRGVRLTERDVNLLMNWGFQAVEGDDAKSKAQAFLDDDAFSGRASLKLPGQTKKYVNVQVAGSLAASAGRVDFELFRMRLGRLRVPGFLLPLVSEIVHATIRTQPDLSRLAGRTEFLKISPGAVKVVVQREGLSEELFGASDVSEERVREATLAQLHYLTGRLERLNRGERAFESFLKAAFSYALLRACEGSDVVEENRAAIFALGILLGHHRVAALLGLQMDDELSETVAAQNGRVPLRGRRDWTRHFCVSAALAAHSNRALSDAAGLLKEELDAGPGGSGFSFSDLLADRAGTRFATVATREERSARSLQLLLARGFQIDDVFPAAADLPEGLSDAELKTQFGGVGGKGYADLVAEIERRLSACRALQ